MTAGTKETKLKSQLCINEQAHHSHQHTNNVFLLCGKIHLGLSLLLDYPFEKAGFMYSTEDRLISDILPISPHLNVLQISVRFHTIV